MITLAVTGPESTGKTAIAEYLAYSLNGSLIPEFAREYIKKIERPYTYEDIEAIARTQVIQRKKASELNPKLIILDTWLIITKIWFQEVYQRYPLWLDSTIMEYPVDLFMVCLPDIPWIPDPVRENGGERRNYLLKRYLDEISLTRIPFEYVSGTGEIRLENALNLARKHYKP